MVFFQKNCKVYRVLSDVAVNKRQFPRPMQLDLAELGLAKVAKRVGLRLTIALVQVVFLVFLDSKIIQKRNKLQISRFLNFQILKCIKINFEPLHSVAVVNVGGRILILEKLHAERMKDNQSGAMFEPFDDV